MHRQSIAYYKEVRKTCPQFTKWAFSIGLTQSLTTREVVLGMMEDGGERSILWRSFSKPVPSTP